MLKRKSHLKYWEGLLDWEVLSGAVCTNKSIIIHANPSHVVVNIISQPDARADEETNENAVKHVSAVKKNLPELPSTRTVRIHTF